MLAGIQQKSTTNKNSRKFNLMDKLALCTYVSNKPRTFSPFKFVVRINQLNEFSLIVFFATLFVLFESDKENNERKCRFSGGVVSLKLLENCQILVGCGGGDLSLVLQHPQVQLLSLVLQHPQVHLDPCGGGGTSALYYSTPRYT